MAHGGGRTGGRQRESARFSHWRRSSLDCHQRDASLGRVRWRFSGEAEVVKLLRIKQV